MYVFELHEYLISHHLIWAVLCSLLYDQEGSLKSINLFASLLISGIFNVLEYKSTGLSYQLIHRIVDSSYYMKTLIIVNHNKVT